MYERNQRGQLRLGRDMAGLCTRLLNSRNPTALSVVLPLLATSDLTRDPYLTGALESLLKDETLPQFENVLRAAAQFPGYRRFPLDARANSGRAAERQ